MINVPHNLKLLLIFGNFHCFKFEALLAVIVLKISKEARKVVQLVHKRVSREEDGFLRVPRSYPRRTSREDQPTVL